MVFTISVRNSRYDSRFMENTKTLEEAMEPLSDEDLRRYRKIKAARTDDLLYSNADVKVQKLVNMVMDSGKKALARDLVFKALEVVKRHQLEKYHKTPDEQLKETIELDPYVILHQAIENGKPLLILKKVRKSGISVSVPISCTPKRQDFLSLRWLIDVSLNKGRNYRFYDRLGKEIIDAFNYQGGLIKKKQDMHKLCEANKANSHLA